MIETTECQLSFSPPNLFEIATVVTFSEGQAQFADGKVSYELVKPADPVTEALRAILKGDCFGTRYRYPDPPSS